MTTGQEQLFADGQSFPSRMEPSFLIIVRKEDVSMSLGVLKTRI